MALVQCKECKTEISSTAATCPKCGHKNPKANNLSGKQVFVGLLGAAVALWFFATGGITQRIENKVASDFVTNYQIAKREGDKMQICVQAGIVTAAYLQAKDEANYRQWKQTKDADCSRAGLPKF